MDFALNDTLLELQARVRDFIARQVIPFETDPRQGPHGPADELRRELNALARAAGLLSPQLPESEGGLGLVHLGRAVVFEEAGYSPLGPLALNVFAPDEGNMHLLAEVADEAQRERWLAPLNRAETRSCFCMTEPPPGAGSDPRMLTTRAVRSGSGYRIDGVKWFITGAEGAHFAIVMADLDGVGATMFLAEMDSPGIVVERIMDSLDTCFAGGHAVVRLEGLEVDEAAILGEAGKGFDYAQVRLAPARLTHCMRWLGAARRANDVAKRHAREREAFGQQLGRHEGVGFPLVDNEFDLYTARLVVQHTAWLLDQGGLRLAESSRAKVIVSEATWRVVDRAVQVLGGQGVTGEQVVARIFADMRAFRIYDGPSEVHRWSLARRLMKDGG